MLNITIAGATGFIGTSLVNRIKNEFKVKGLSRANISSNEINITYAKTDLFSLSSTTDSLKDTDIAIYLVHSMMPSSRLFQGDFHDTDLILADNFLHACVQNNVKQIIYLGGIVPTGFISEHLESRKEVEEVLKSSHIPCTILRAGMVVGNGGSSFEILKNLVHTLPAMVLPKWTETKTQIIYLDDLIEIINFSINNPETFDITMDVVNGENIRYRDLIEQTRQHLGKKGFLIPVPINYTSFSKLWVSIFGKSEYELVSPLIDSLLCDFSGITPSPYIKDLIGYKTYSSMLPNIKIKKAKRKPKTRLNSNNVRSIQRLPHDGYIAAEDIALSYIEWLPKHMRSLILVDKVGKGLVNFRLKGLNKPLLTLQYIHNPQEKDRVKFHIIGGLLSKTHSTGWLEFRNIDNGKYILASINEFYPSLPWYIYKISQAPLHKLTMKNFGKYLKKNGKK